ncbi:MAG: peptidylprolyl isomerase, partial [Promethearchaeota archaeon]
NMMFQVHLNWIVVATEEDCDEAITRIKSGESFANVAKDISLDMATKDKGGDLGWVPPVISLDEYIINNLMVNEVSEPLAHFSQQLPDSPSQQSQEPDYWYIYMVSEKDNSRIVDSTDLLILKSNALDDWYNQEIKNHDIRYNFNTEIYTWIIDQLEEDNDYSN